MSALCNKKRCKEMLMRRMFLAVVSNIMVRCLFVISTILATNLSVDFTSWFQDARTTIANFQTWNYCFVLASATFLQGIVCSKRYLSGPPYPTSRFFRLRGLFTIQNLLIELLYISVGGIFVWIHLSSEGGRYSSPIRNCGTLPGICLVEEYYFLLLSGLWAGMNSCCKTYLLGTNYPTFSAIPQSKFFQLERGIYTMIPSVMITSVRSTLYFVLAYYFLGSEFRSILLWFGAVQMESEPLDSLAGLSNPSLILYVWLYHLIYALSVGSMYLSFEIYLTEWVSFEICQTGVYDMVADSRLTLPEAMSSDNVPILQHLGYLDLFVLAQKDKIRRQTLFTLSEPGGYPYSWNCVAENCMNLLKRFSANLDEALRKSKEQRSLLSSSSSSPCSPSLQSSSPPPQSAASSAASSAAPLAAPPAALSPPWTVPITPALTAISSASEYLKQRGCSYRMRNLITTEETTVDAAKANKKLTSLRESFAQKFSNGVRHIVTASGPYRMFRRILAYAFDELEDNKIRYLLLNGQTVIWGVEAISSLSVLSLKEDAYGIVQRDLPIIINTLLQVKRSLDKLQKSNLLPRKQQGEDRVVRQIFSSLRSATRRSIYRITTNFKAYVGDLSLEPVTVEQLQHFLQYKE